MVKNKIKVGIKKTNPNDAIGFIPLFILKFPIKLLNNGPIWAKELPYPTKIFLPDVGNSSF